MGRNAQVVRAAVAATLALTVAAGSAFAQGKGKGGGQDEKGRGKGGQPAQIEQRGGGGQSRADKPGNAANHGRGSARRAETPGASSGEGRGNAARAGRGDRGNDSRARSDERIQRRIEREFAGDVDLRPERRFARRVALDDLRPGLRTLYVSDRLPAKVAVGAVARAHLRGVDDDLFTIAPVDDRVVIRNRSGVVLVDLDEREARDLGRWSVVPLSDGVEEGAPSFCRSGAGHPVWGRQWCLDKGFGLGGYEDVRWGRTTNVGNIIFRNVSPTGSLVGDALVGVLGQIAFDRLGLHAVTLGYADPLRGVWMGEPSGPRVLLLSSGSRPVAEVVDLNRDDRADLMVIALRDY